MGNIYRSRLADRAEEKTSRFITSLQEDERIFEVDINGTEAHNIMLYEQGIISIEDRRKILSALEKLRHEKREGRVPFDPKYEDVHELIEDYVIKEVGLKIGGKLHTGRSRNDQVALDIRMSLRSGINEISAIILSIVEILLTHSVKHKEIPMMLYTHTQHAQIGSFAQYLMAYADALLRDFQRLRNCYDRINLSPLGAGPIGGTNMAINRTRTAFLLGFDGVLENSIDAISSRDFMLETTSVLAILMSGLSRIAEDLILWTSTEFGYVEIDDRYASVSSIMPQKKNPNVLELIRGKTGRVYGHLMSLLSMIKGLQTGYSSDLQETKIPVWDCVDTVKSSLEILTGVIATLKVNTKRIAVNIDESYAFAVDLTECLTEMTDLSFREAHMVIGNLVREMTTLGIKPKELTSKHIERLIDRVLGKKIPVDKTLVEGVTNVEKVLLQRKSVGNPSPKEVGRMLKTRIETLQDHKRALAVRTKQLKVAERRLTETVLQYVEGI